eukprot:TRINITY_DN11518_c0_g1_i4.p1 TRINITY_DN11518_c0_g1~~TRINITY_DN11518_c0_g1_i4.p1  ORF type:complete len:223 (+),score=22.00 TRINITY_DN11518_c0_g1_i4:61-669(+)
MCIRDRIRTNPELGSANSNNNINDTNIDRLSRDKVFPLRALPMVSSLTASQDMLMKNLSSEDKNIGGSEFSGITLINNPLNEAKYKHDLLVQSLTPATSANNHKPNRFFQLRQRLLFASSNYLFSRQERIGIYSCAVAVLMPLRVAPLRQSSPNCPLPFVVFGFYFALCFVLFCCVVLNFFTLLIRFFGLFFKFLFVLDIFL